MRMRIWKNEKYKRPRQINPNAHHLSKNQQETVAGVEHKQCKCANNLYIDRQSENPKKTQKKRRKCIALTFYEHVLHEIWPFLLQTSDYY